MKYCGYCGKQIDEDMKFCPYCGKQVELGTPRQTVSGAKRYCGRCGRAMPSTVKFCPWCGAQAGTAKTESKQRSKPSHIGRAHKPTKRRWIAAVAAVLVVCMGVGGFLAWNRGMLQDLFNPSAKYHTEANGYVSDGREFTYVSPTDESHLKPVDEGNEDILYADNELIVQLSNPVTEAEARKLARENGAELVGFISVSGTCQWRFKHSNTQGELKTQAESCEKDDRIEMVNLNYLINYSLDDLVQWNQVPLNDWLYSEESWGYFDINADYAYDHSHLMKDAVNICIYDGGFDPHYDLDYTYNTTSGLQELIPERWRECVDHGMHVTGIVGANCDNALGIRGIFPRTNKESRLYGECWVGQTNIQIINTVVGTVLKNYRIINMSFGMPDAYQARWFLSDEGKINFKETEQEDFEEHSWIMEKCLSALMDGGYQFILVKSAGNASSRNEDTIYYYNPDTYEITYRKADTATWSEIQTYTDFNIPTSYSFFTNIITNDAVKNRILVCGAYNKKHNIAAFSQMDERVDILAPGVNIFSTVRQTRNRGIGKMNGTSMSTPFVTGALACIWSMDKTLTAEEVRSLLLLEWPKEWTGEGESPETTIKNSNKIYTISDDDYSAVSRPALNLKASLELAEAYIAWKNGQDIQPSDAEKLNVVQVKTVIDPLDGTPLYETSEARLKIVDANGRVYADGNGTDYQRKTESAEDGTPVYKPVESAYYIALPDGEYTVEVSLNGYQTIEEGGLSPRSSYNESLFQNSSNAVTWCFVLKSTALTSTPTLEPTPRLLPTLTPAPKPWANLEYNALFQAQIDALVAKYDVMAGGAQIKENAGSKYMQRLWTSGETEGMLFADIFDYDLDGVPELLTYRNVLKVVDNYDADQSEDDMYLEIYEADADGCHLADSKVVRAEALSMGVPGTAVSVFRYEREGKPAVGVMCETDSGSDWIFDVLSYGYTGEALSLNGGAAWGEWPGAYAEDEGDEGYLSTCMEAVSEESALHTSASGDTFDYWRVVASSGRNFSDPEVFSVYRNSLSKLGLAVRGDSSLWDQLTGSGRFGGTYDANDPYQEYHIRYRNAADSFEAVEGTLTQLGNLTSEYFYDAQLYFAKDYLYKDMQEFIATGNLVNGNVEYDDGFIVEFQERPKTEPIFQPSPEFFDTPELSSDDSESALRKKVLNAYNGTGDIQAFGYSDFDWDGRHEAFALIGVYDDSDWENTCELWFVSADACTCLERDKGYYPGESALVTEGTYSCFTVSEGYFGSGSKVRYWTVLDGQPVLHSQREYAGQSGEVSREVYLSPSGDDGNNNTGNYSYGGTVSVREAGLKSNVRTGPGLDYDTIGVLTGGMDLEFMNETSIDGRGVTWYKVRFKGREGWVSEKYTKLDTD